MEILKISFSAAILIVAIVLFRSIAMHKLAKKTFIVLWAVALCRLLIPFSLPSQLNIFTLANRIAFAVSPPTAVLPAMAVNAPDAEITQMVIGPMKEAAAPAVPSAPMLLYAMG